VGARVSTLAVQAEDSIEAPLCRLVLMVRTAQAQLLALDTLADRDAPNAALSDWLYTHWYSSPPTNWQAAKLPVGRSNLVPVLRAAHAATGRWQKEWVALSAMPDNACLAGRGQQTRIVAPGDYANVARPGVPVAPGDGLAVLDRLDWVDEPTGFWGARSIDAEPAHPLMRIYWSTGYDNVGKLLRQLVPVLDAVQRPWSLKCPTLAQEFSRVDSLVVYVARADWPVIEPRVRALAIQLAPRLRQEVPPFTLRIARGVAIADSPGPTQSFGQSRCMALADGVRALLARRDAGMSEGIVLLKQSLQGHAIDPGRPWLCD
jgi:hypothetical protein